MEKESTDKSLVLGVPFSKMTMTETVAWVRSRLFPTNCSTAEDLPINDNHPTTHIVTANPEIVMAAQTDASLRQAILEADIITPDGTGIVWAANFLGNSVSERVAGYDLLHAICQSVQPNETLTVYLLGAQEETNRLAAEKLVLLYPQVQIVGRHHGFFQGEEEQAIRNEIKRLRPQLLLVALGFPRQELWIHQYKRELGVNVAIGVGGSLDVLAGKVKRAPMLWQKLRIEWLYRLLKEPSRWRRQAVLPKFVLAVRKSKKQLRNL